MFVSVKLLKGWQKELWYIIPEKLLPIVSIGSILQVPLRNHLYPAIVLNIQEKKPLLHDLEIKELSTVQTMPVDRNYHTFIATIHALYFLPSHYMYKRFHALFTSKPPRITSTYSRDHHVEQNIDLTDEQEKAINAISDSFEKKIYAPHLLHGITGSGKTIVYHKLIKQILTAQKSVLFIIPEVSLALKFVEIFKTFLEDSTVVHGFHSGSSAPEKKQLWQDICSGKPILIIGVHLPVIIPIENLGLIIVDEEHEQGFQEKKHPRFHSKELVLLRAKTYKIPIVLGSATPSIQTIFVAQKENWPILTLKKRFNSGKLPSIEKISLLIKDKRPCFWLSKRLLELITDRLAKKEQSILFINRRGYSFFAQCKLCAFIFQCSSCSVSLTVHQSEKGRKLSCHYCSFSMPMPSICPSCNAQEKSLLTKGIGTQKLFEILTELFPDANIARADLDTTKKKKSWQETVSNMESGKINILIGTQSITKGYHFPHVTLVGIIWADLHLHMPVFSAAEKTLQQLLQVAGRAGRTREESLVVVQYMHEAELFNFLNEENYQQFYKTELAMRQEARYPPYCRLISLDFYHADPSVVDEESEWCAEFLEQLASHNKKEMYLLGPAKPVVHKVKNIEMRQIFLKAKNFNEVYPLIKKMLEYEFSSKIHICPTQS